MTTGNKVIKNVMMFAIKNICRLIGNVTRPITVKCLLRYFTCIRNCSQKLVSFTPKDKLKTYFCHVVRGSLTSSWMNQKSKSSHHFCRTKEAFQMIWESGLMLWKTTRWCRSNAHLGELCGGNILLSGMADERSLEVMQSWTHSSEVSRRESACSTTG